jgi:hypothetical protein
VSILAIIKVSSLLSFIPCDESHCYIKQCYNLEYIRVKSYISIKYHGEYEIKVPQSKTKVTVKTIDMLVEEVINIFEI